VKASHTVTPVFDDPNLVSAAGLVPVMRLAETAGLHDLLDERLSVDSPNPTVKTSSIVAGMLAGADSIDDLDLLRHGAMGKLFAGVRAPSTLGTYLRSFTHGHVQQLDAVAARLLTGLTDQVPGLLDGADQMTFVDVDAPPSTSCRAVPPRSARCTATPALQCLDHDRVEIEAQVRPRGAVAENVGFHGGDPGTEPILVPGDHAERTDTAAVAHQLADVAHVCPCHQDRAGARWHSAAATGDVLDVVVALHESLQLRAVLEV